MKLTFDEALERLNDGRYVRESEVLADALTRKVWVAEWHLPGCLSESQVYVTTKADAIQAALDFAGDEAPRGMKTALTGYRHFQHKTEMYGAVITTIDVMVLRNLL